MSQVEHFEFPKTSSKEKLLESLDTFLSSPEEAWAEFERLQVFSRDHISGDTDTATLGDNRGKNRYKDIVPYNWRSVRIPDREARPGEEQNKYINASWIVFKHFKQNFIASQGPIHDTVSDFWSCVTEHEVGVIVMLTGLVEGDMVKCARYWPDPATKNIILGDFEVTAEEEIRDGDDIILTRLGVTPVDEEAEAKARNVIHIQVKGWGDHSVPDNTSTLLHSIKRVQDLAKSKRFSPPSPVLVHCSAGVGRTGTWIAVYRLISSLSSPSLFSRPPSPWAVVTDMRTARPKMVQRREQYAFIFKCLRDFLAQKKK